MGIGDWGLGIGDWAQSTFKFLIQKRKKNNYIINQKIIKIKYLINNLIINKTCLILLKNKL